MQPILTVPVTGRFPVSGQDVKLTVIVGEQQQGFSLVMLADKELGSGKKIRDLVLGAAADLAGKTLEVDTTVAVTNAASMRTSVQIVLTDGARSVTFQGSQMLGAVGDSVIYEGRIALVTQ